jgi:hypothetical protein
MVENDQKDTDFFEVLAICRPTPDRRERVEANTIEARSKADANQQVRDQYGVVRVRPERTVRVRFDEDGRRHYNEQGEA